MSKWWKLGRVRRSLVSALAVCALVVTAASTPVFAATQGVGNEVAPATAARGQGDLAQLSRRVRDLIRVVETSDVPCDTRNTVVRRLRLLDDALLSGRRTGAAALLASWRARAEKMASARLLSASANDAVQQRLSAIEDEIGLGWPKKPKPTRNWPKLPECHETSGAQVTATATDTWNSSDTLTVLTTLLYMIPSPLGSLAAGFLTLMWPTNGGPDVSTIVDQKILEDALSDSELTLTGLRDLVADDFEYKFNGWLNACPGRMPDGTPDCDISGVSAAWDRVTGAFIEFKPHFQQKTSLEDNRTALLPLYVQMENLFLAHLQIGVIYRNVWWSATADRQWPIDLMQREIETQPGDPPKLGGAPDASVPDVTGVGYVEDVYQVGLDERAVSKNSYGETNLDDWRAQNAWARDIGTVQALYFSDTWPFLDPLAYPNGNPEYKQTRMIYSDPIGLEEHYYAGRIAPDNVSVPLAYLEVWPDNNVDYLRDTPVIDAIRVGWTNNNSSPVMGDPSPEGLGSVWRFSADPDYAPIINIHVAEGYQSFSDPYQNFHWPQGFTFTFGDGGTATVGSFNTTTFWGSPLKNSKMHLYDYGYDNQVLATANVLDQQEWTNVYEAGQTSATGVIFGFRFSDSLPY